MGTNIEPRGPVPAPAVTEHSGMLAGMAGDGMDHRQLEQMLRAMLAFRDGDFTQRLPPEWTGVPGKIADSFNEILVTSERRAKEALRVCQAVGKEGKLQQRMTLTGVSGGWAEEILAHNTLIDDLTRPVAEITRVIGAVAKGDLGQSMVLEVDSRSLEGEFLRSAKIINSMIDQLSVFTSEVTRVAREVGTEGKLGGQAAVPGVAGTWKDLTDNVNSMAANLTAQVRNIAEVTIAVANGDLSRKITVDVRGEFLQLKETINTMVEQLRGFASEVTRVVREVGTEGHLGVQGVVPGVAGTWKDLTDSVNAMASNLTAQVRNIAEVTTAVARGDLSRTITADAKGEILELKNTINTMVEQLNAFSSEVTRVAREVGTDGKLGGQAVVPGAAGTWKDLTDSVNIMAANLTDQVRGIVKVVTAVANGNLREKLTVEAKGEIAALAETINNMTDTLAIFAEQVTNVAREVGVEGRLGGQAHVPGAAGTWKDLIGNVNLLAANLSTQVRAIADVATAVTKGDMTRSIQVNARGEVAELKDNVNTMIGNLRATTERNQEQDWLKTNLARFAGMLQGQRDLFAVGQMLLSELAPLVQAQQGTIYEVEAGEPMPSLRLLAGYAQRRDQPERIALGEGLVGQCAVEKQPILLTEVPPGYAQIHSSLGAAGPKNIVVLPVLFEGETKAVIELAAFRDFTTTHITFLEQLTQSIGAVFNTIEATMRTESLLKQSQQLTAELQAQKKELQQTNEELETKARQLAEQNAEVERKNNEIEQARRALEEKATELALTSKYKSEFLANMSHELRTPLNSILILGQQLTENPTGNLTARQVDFARDIHSAGSDLLALIDDILDLSKIESGTVTVEVEELSFVALRESVDSSFRRVAESKNLELRMDFDPDLPQTFTTDPKRLKQVLKNLLSNAVKFTAQGCVTMHVFRAAGGWNPDHRVLGHAPQVIAMAITDTGIGIALEKQKIIFEAFQQADAGTSRKYGGTGLGLAISRELATLLGGEIRLTSEPGKGSTFTLYLPLTHIGSGSSSAVPTAPKVPLPAPTRSGLRDTRAEIIPDDRDPIQEVEAGSRAVLHGRKALVVDDDARNIFALATTLENVDMEVLTASNGRQAIEIIERTPDLAVVLMDIMLPEMDGFHTIQEIRKNPRFRSLPILALTAKVMKGDREKCLEAGASDYIAKPVDIEQLLTLLRVWLKRQDH